LISTDQSLTLATGNGQVLIDPNNVIVGPLTATGMASAKGTETVESRHLVIFDGTNGNNTPGVAYPIDDGREISKFQNGLGIGNENSPAYTLDTASHSSVALPNYLTVRRLTPKECERLQGFPDNWTLEKIDQKGNLVEQKDSARYKQCGNAVTVSVVQWIMERLVEAHKG